MDRDTSGNVTPEDPNLLAIYKLVEDRSMIIMLHPKPSQREAVSEWWRAIRR